MEGPRYDTIGLGYAATRLPDPRIAAQIWDAVGTAERIVNVGAGTGSYEDPRRSMVAVEPSTVMIRQRRHSAAPVVRAGAEELPFGDHAFDVALALMTVHHWRDLRQGLAELRRVAPRQVVFTFEPGRHDSSWVFTEYVTAALGLGDVAPLEVVVEELAATRVEVVPIPFDCTDGFATAFWRRPEQYLSASVRAGISAFARLGDAQIAPGLTRLSEDLASGEWHRRHAELLTMTSIDGGLRLVVAG